MTETLLAQTLNAWPLWVYKIPGLVFLFCFGACVGSFINVVSYRLPAGISVISPPSRCPTCGVLLRWYENFPIIGWLRLRGKCASCGVAISPQYVLIEFLMACLFLALGIYLYILHPAMPWEGTLPGPWWYYQPARTLPALTVLLILIASLVAMTLIDARTFTIPLQIPVVATIVAVVGYAVQAIVHAPAKLGQLWPIPLVDGMWLSITIGGIIGLVISFVLLKAKVFRYSFADYNNFVKEGETLGEYPHARREMLVELLYLLPCIVGLLVGWLIGRTWSGVELPLFIAALGACGLGYIVGGGLVWGIRIFGSLAFGREAMGLGDVHLLAAVGAALGWRDPIFIFFGAAFVGLFWVLLTLLLGGVFKGIRRELPYGPHLAVTTLLVIAAHHLIYPHIWQRIVP